MPGKKSLLMIILSVCFQVDTEKFITFSAMMMDVMAPVTALSQFFQTENVDIALVKVSYMHWSSLEFSIEIIEYQ